MKPFLSNQGRKKRGGFSLVEATFSIGILSFGILTLAPLLVVGMKSSRIARDDRTTTQIAQNLVEEARQRTLAPGTIYLDSQGAACPAAKAAYTAQATSLPVAGNAALTQTTLRLTPVGAPDRARTYAVVLPSAE